eukprot:scaffold18754_cov155-Skeletonema_dohrnii-CCMP3373.AAC.3
MQQDKVVPVSALGDIEICIEGVLFTSSLHPVDALMDVRKWDGETRKEVCGVGTEHGVCVTWPPGITIHVFPNERTYKSSGSVRATPRRLLL